MNKAFKGKVSTFILTLVLGIITASFLFSSVDKFNNAPSIQDVGDVDGTPIRVKEYQLRLQQQVDFFAQMMGGKVDQKQLEQMGIKESVLNGLIQQKLLYNAARKMGLVMSQEELKTEIKKLPYFKTNNQFDVNKYKQLLTMNQYTPAQFEETITEEMMTKKIEELLTKPQVSLAVAKQVIDFKNQRLKVHVLKIDRQELAKLVTVSPAEVKEFVAKPENKKSLEGLYEENLTKYQRPAEVKASHILFAIDEKHPEAEALAEANKAKAVVTLKNFAQKAKELTQDPTGKNNGGSVGWFSKGRMVPEFEEAAFKAQPNTIIGPIKSQFGYHVIFVEDKKMEDKKELAQVQDELAVQILQRRKVADLDALFKNKLAEYTKALQDNQLKVIEAEKLKVNLKWSEGSEINRYDLSLSGSELSSEEGQKLFSAKAGDVLNFSNPGSLFLAKVVGETNVTLDPAKEAEIYKNEQSALSLQLSRKVREELLKEMNASSKIVTNPALL